MNRAIMLLQEKALAALVRVGDAEPHTVTYEAVEPSGEIKIKQKKLYKTVEDQRYDLRAKPREVPKFQECCLTCKHKYYQCQPEGHSEATRMCNVHHKEVLKYDRCERYDMREYLKRL